ncbi:MAG: deiodinase-like protein, partial [Planctomycetaceae bacterium]
IDKVFLRYRERAEFFAVYIKEAHPTDGWASGSNRRAGIDIVQAKKFSERVAAASQCCGALQMQVPLIVDGIDNRVGEAYSGFPDRLYLIDTDGKVAYKGGRGPFGFIPQELEQALLLLLLDDSLKRPAVKQSTGH